MSPSSLVTADRDRSSPADMAAPLAVTSSAPQNWRRRPSSAFPIGYRPHLNIGLRPGCQLQGIDEVGGGAVSLHREALGSRLEIVVVDGSLRFEPGAHYSHKPSDQ